MSRLLRASQSVKGYGELGWASNVFSWVCFDIKEIRCCQHASGKNPFQWLVIHHSNHFIYLTNTDTSGVDPGIIVAMTKESHCKGLSGFAKVNQAQSSSLGKVRPRTTPIPGFSPQTLRQPEFICHCEQKPTSIHVPSSRYCTC